MTVARAAPREVAVSVARSRCLNAEIAEAAATKPSRFSAVLRVFCVKPRGTFHNLRDPMNHGRDRFEAFAAKKTAEATAAALPAYVTEFEHAPTDSTDWQRWSRRLFDGDFFASPRHGASRPACSLVFVQSGDSNTVTNDPSKLGGGKTDKHLIYEGLSQVAAGRGLIRARTPLAATSSSRSGIPNSCACGDARKAAASDPNRRDAARARLRRASPVQCARYSSDRAHHRERRETG